jgi:2'-5' RNA ligase
MPVDWPAVWKFTDHWTWRPDWTANRPRVLWYLTFGEDPAVSAATATTTRKLKNAGSDVVPPQWLHLTLTDVGFADEIGEHSLRAAGTAIRDALKEMPPFQLNLGPVSVLPGAVVLAAQPVEPLHHLRTLVREANAGVGIRPPDDIQGEFLPHVSLCYVNRRTDQTRLWDAVRSADAITLRVRCDRLTQVVVTRTDARYRWKVRDEVPFWGAQVHQQGRAKH